MLYGGGGGGGSIRGGGVTLVGGGGCVTGSPSPLKAGLSLSHEENRDPFKGTSIYYIISNI